MPEALNKLRPEQLHALKWSDRLSHVGFFLDMRLGKCKLTMRRWKRWKIQYPILIVAPFQAMRSWEKEAAKEGLPKITRLIGTDKDRLKILYKALEGSTPILMINPQGYRPLPEIADIHWWSIVLDEATFISKPRASVSKFYLKYFDHVKHRIILTGTPDTSKDHNLLDYFNLLKFLDKKSLPWKNYWEFITNGFFHVGYDRCFKRTTKDKLIKAISKYTYTARRGTHGRQKTYIAKYAELPNKFKKVYNTLENEYILEFKGKVLASTVFAPVAYGKMVELCGGFIEKNLVHTAKLDLLEDLLLNDLKHEHPIIVCRYTHEIDYIHAHLKNKLKLKAVKLYGSIKEINTRDRIIEKFNKKITYPLITQAQVFSYGVDASASTSIIYYSQPVRPDHRRQSEDRIVTLSDNKDVLIVDILVENTVDEDYRDEVLKGNKNKAMFERTLKRYEKNI